MATAQGTAIIDFGAFPGSNEASVLVTTGVAAISATSKVSAFIMGDDFTGDHTANDHRYVGLVMSLTCGTPVAGTNFRIYARSREKLQGTYALRWVFAD